MKITIFALLFLLPSLSFSQQINSSQKLSQKFTNEKKFEAQLMGNLFLNGDPVKSVGTEARLSYCIVEGIFLGAGALFAYDVNVNYFSPNASVAFKLSMNRTASYLKFAAGPNFTSVGESTPGIFYSIGGGVEYRINDFVGMNFELSVKSFSYHKEISGMSVDFSNPKVNGLFRASYFAPSVGLNWKF